MATSGALSTDNDNIKYKITINQNSQNVSGNTSNVSVSVKVYRTNSGYTTYGTGTIYCKINGTTYSASITSDDKITSSGIVLFSKTLNIAHASDGTKKLTVSSWINHSQFDSSEQSYSLTLTTIPRATTPTISSTSVDMGASVTVSMPRASSSFTHTLKYSFGSTSGTIGTGLGTSKAWTVPLSLANQIPNATSGKLTITCETYNGSTKIGSKNLTITIKVPASVVPTISSVTVAETESGLADKFKAFVKDKSKPKVTINASGAYSSTISSYSTKFLGKTYSGKSFTVGLLTSEGSLSFSVTIKDSRGRSATTTKTISVLDYENPKINSFTVIRANSDGTPNDEGSSLLISYSFNIASLNNLNDKSFSISMKSPTNTSFIKLMSGNVYSANTTFIPEGIISPDSTYIIRLTISDYFREVVHDIEAPTAFTLIDYHSTGRGISFGKVAEYENLFDVNLPVRLRKGLIIDSDWIPLTIDDAYALYGGNADNQPMYKVTGNVVTVKGVLSPKVAYTSSATPVVIAKGIPSELRPDEHQQFVCQGSGMARWNCAITTAGTVTMARYGITEFSTVPTTAWLTFSCTYSIGANQTIALSSLTYEELEAYTNDELTAFSYE